jgi:hypothetical protein
MRFIAWILTLLVLLCGRISIKVNDDYFEYKGIYLLMNEKYLEGRGK